MGLQASGWQGLQHAPHRVKGKQLWRRLLVIFCICGRRGLRARPGGLHEGSLRTAIYVSLKPRRNSVGRLDRLLLLTLALYMASLRSLRLSPVSCE